MLLQMNLIRSDNVWRIVYVPWCGILCPGVREVQDKGKLLEVMRLGPMLPASWFSIITMGASSAWQQQQSKERVQATISSVSVLIQSHLNMAAYWWRMNCSLSWYLCIIKFYFFKEAFRILDFVWFWRHT